MQIDSKAVWGGRAISTLMALVFLLSAVMKLRGGPEVTQEMARLGLSESQIGPIAILEIACVAVYAIPQTAVLGAILLAGYAGGAILTHVRVGDPFVGPAVLGALVWLGLYLREPRLRALLPLRKG